MFGCSKQNLEGYQSSFLEKVRIRLVQIIFSSARYMHCCHLLALPMACLQPLPLIFSMAYHTACLLHPPYRGFFQHVLSVPSCDWYPICHHQGSPSALAFFCCFLHHRITKHGSVWCRVPQTSCSGTVCASNIFNVPGPGHSEIRYYFTLLMINFPSKFFFFLILIKTWYFISDKYTFLQKFQVLYIYTANSIHTYYFYMYFVYI